jgi:hypothetical protein
MNQLVLSDEILQGISDLANQLNLSIDLTFPVKSENDDRIRVSSSLLLPTS